MSGDVVRDGRHLMNLGTRYRHLAMLKVMVAEAESMAPRAPWFDGEGRIHLRLPKRFQQNSAGCAAAIGQIPQG